MGIILDFCLVLMVFCFVNSGIKRGFVRSLSEMIGALIAISAAIYLSSIVAQFLYDEFLRQEIISRVSESIQGVTEQNANTKVDELFNNLPFIISNSFRYYGITSANINDTIINAKDDAAASIADMIAPIIINLLRTLLVSIIFIILMFFIRIVIRSICSVCRLPGLRQIDALLGAAFGGIKCMLFIMILMFVIQLILPMFDVTPEILSDSTIESTVIFKHIYNNNLLYGLFNKLDIQWTRGLI